jgi:predicted membrane-bound mannosyltransferase
MTSLRFPSAARTTSRRFAVSLPRVRPEFAALLIVAAGLNLWALERNGLANEYYAAAAQAMSSSWHAFLYGSFDAAGVMTVDKPPLALWVQAISVKLFGFHPLALLIPQALMGVASVALVYDLVRRRFGRAAGFVAGLVLALTPIGVAIARHNNPDALLVLCCVAALWCALRALDDGRTRWLVMAGVCVGLGFETKMGAALLVVPGIAAAYLWVAPRGRAIAVRQLLAGAAALVMVGALAIAETAPVRKAALGVALTALLIAPATWSVQTLGHATSGTFPAGGPASAGFAGGPGGQAGPGGGMFGGDTALTDAIAYARENGGGTIAVSSQSSAAAAVPKAPTSRRWAAAARAR